MVSDLLCSHMFRYYCQRTTLSLHNYSSDKNINIMIIINVFRTFVNRIIILLPYHFIIIIIYYFFDQSVELIHLVTILSDVNKVESGCESLGTLKFLALCFSCLNAFSPFLMKMCGLHLTVRNTMLYNRHCCCSCFLWSVCLYGQYVHVATVSLKVALQRVYFLSGKQHRSREQNCGEQST